STLLMICPIVSTSLKTGITTEMLTLSAIVFLSSRFIQVVAAEPARDRRALFAVRALPPLAASVSAIARDSDRSRRFVKRASGRCGLDRANRTGPVVPGCVTVAVGVPKEMSIECAHGQ